MPVIDTNTLRNESMTVFEQTGLTPLQLLEKYREETTQVFSHMELRGAHHSLGGGQAVAIDTKGRVIKDYKNDL